MSQEQVLTIWMWIGAVWLVGVFAWRFGVERGRHLYGEGPGDRWTRALIWPVMAFLIAGIWIAFKGWPLVLVAGLVAYFFAVSMGYA